MRFPHLFQRRAATAVSIAVLAFVGLAQTALAQGAALGSGVARAYMDTTCAPCRDFYRFAYHESLKGRPAPVIDGLTGDQRFFIAAAQAWRRKWRPDMLRSVVLTNEHAPSEFRVNGPLANLAEFARVFGCKAGDPMVRPEALRGSIW